MAQKSYKINNLSWTKISDAGQKGSCWVEQVIEGNGNVRVFHTDGAAPDLSQVRLGYSVRNPETNPDTVQLGPDNGSDVYYAITDKDNTTIDLIADMRS